MRMMAKFQKANTYCAQNLNRSICLSHAQPASSQLSPGPHAQPALLCYHVRRKPTSTPEKVLICNPLCPTPFLHPPHVKHINTTTFPFAHPYRHCPSTVQGAHSSSQDVPGTGTTASGGQGDSLHGTTGTCYPNMLGWNRLVFDSNDVDYSHLSKLIVSTNDNNSYLPLEGDLVLKFTGTTILQS